MSLIWSYETCDRELAIVRNELGNCHAKFDPYDQTHCWRCESHYILALNRMQIKSQLCVNVNVRFLYACECVCVCTVQGFVVCYVYRDTLCDFFVLIFVLFFFFLHSFYHPKLQRRRCLFTFSLKLRRILHFMLHVSILWWCAMKNFLDAIRLEAKHNIP